MIARGNNFQQYPLDIVGSSTFGRYPKISARRTYNMFMSDNFMVPYAGYVIAENASAFMGSKSGRGIYTSTKFNSIFIVMDNNAFRVQISFDPLSSTPYTTSITFIGNLTTPSGVVYIAENNLPQIAISDGANIYIYDANNLLLTKADINFVPGYITFHDTYFICAAKADGNYTPVATNTWRLSQSDNGLIWLNDSASIGFLQTKPDNTQAVVRFPSKGNMILVMGQIVTESWFDTGAQLFPYQRTNQFNIDYGCLSPATVAYMDELVVWLAANEQSGPIIMYSMGGMPEKVTTDGIDYFFSQLTNPSDSQAFIYRQDGHLFYHINFYADNVSLFVDFLPDGTHKIYHACDQNLNYFIAAKVAFYGNQYYFISKNTGNLYAFDTIYTTYQDSSSNDTTAFYETPRYRICGNIRLISQEYRIINDIGFTIETGETQYQYVTSIVDGVPVQVPVTPSVSLSMSRDGGATFGSDFKYQLNPIGQRTNRLMWWQCGIANDAVCQFNFSGMGRFVITDGIANLRQ